MIIANREQSKRSVCGCLIWVVFCRSAISTTFFSRKERGVFSREVQHIFA